MAVGSGEEDFRRQAAGSGDISCCRGRGGHRSGNDKVDDGVGVAAPARWRMGWQTEEAGCSAEVVVLPTVYEWGNGGEGDLKLWDALL